MDILKSSILSHEKKLSGRQKIAQNLRLFGRAQQIAIGEGLEDLGKVRQDSPVVETNRHFTTNNSQVWDCIKESHWLLGHPAAEVNGLDYRDYTKGAKKTY
ncbi:hypothetical protein [Pricia antarctica]|uniref:hypothetical protein n=1 Tax=Pricia antarctica TaxID=641691 RepID=UPI001587A63C